VRPPFSYSDFAEWKSYIHHSGNEGMSCGELAL
jgi:hypothetical protein